MDPTLLINDFYAVRLTVFDTGGNFAQASVNVQVSRNQKVGNLSLAFQDLNVPVAGIPITVVRRYDSRDKGQGDFGVGWRLGVQSIRLRVAGVQGSRWQVDSSGGVFPTFTSSPTGNHKVSITLPDGKVEEFDFTPQPSAQALVPFTELVAAYTPRALTRGSLVPIHCVRRPVNDS